MHRADEHVDLVARDEPVGVVGCLGRLRLIIDLEKFHFPAAELATRLLQRKLQSVFDRDAKLGVRTRIRQHQTETQLRGLRTRMARPKRCCCQSARADQELAPVKWVVVHDYSLRCWSRLHGFIALSLKR